MFEATLVYVAKSPAMATQRPHLKHPPQKQKVVIELIGKKYSEIA